ncbi:efflux RND transporter periplasmic adaptor subunit [Roseicyclus mahoneyensis]|uniref:RND family efflux transporter MFP subunit n=1 Tax=Roseicyclus mahoneyensis TaxID=164332 RepID=A0A316GDU5_9RHOB|nr:efflux RND transporter periplasmic adaptor subunit [Roseicyclus mahoneyensis]PWK59151.1 RND family efflux transporter MFP subunit [Roseicyclus mahoneyensis]
MARGVSGLRKLGQGLATLAVVAVSVGAVAGGAGLIAGSAAPVSHVAPAPVPVAAMAVEMSAGYTVTRRFTGQIEAAARTDLGFEPGGRVRQVLVEEGDLVAEGQVLALLDTSILIPERAALEADLAALAADAELARLTLARSDALTERGVRSVAAQDDARLALQRAEAGMAAIRARIAGVDVRLDQSVLTAPFAARVGARLADPGQTVAPGERVLVLFDAAPARARIGLPPDLAAGLSVGDAVMVDLGGSVQAATIRQIRPDLDPATRSRAVVLTLPSRPEAVLGNTVALILEQRVEEPGFWAPLSGLREGVRGSWSVMALEQTPQGDRTVPAAVEVIHTEGARVYLRGQLPPGARIVAESPDRVASGQLVLAALAVGAAR